MSDWRWWTILVILISTAYVQNVGWHIEKLSGVKRAKNLKVYRYLFGGKPWIPWLMFRWGGMIVMATIVLVFVLFGPRRGSLTTIAVIFSPFTFWRIARTHARYMLPDLLAAIADDTGSIV